MGYFLTVLLFHLFNFFLHVAAAFVFIHFWPCSKKEEKNYVFPFHFIAPAININESGLCDNEIPPSSPRAGVT